MKDLFKKHVDYLRLANTVPLLDHGYVKLRNISGPTRRKDAVFDADDIDPANTARISFDSLDSGRSRETDLRLYEYLMKNRHSTPVEMIEIWIEMKLPIFLAREFIRHRTASVNEVSARYVKLEKEWYVPMIVGGKPTNGAKQGQEDNLDMQLQEQFKADLHKACLYSYNKYEDYISAGVAPEHARLFLHVNHYTRWIWKQDLHNIMHFLALRLDEHAAIEARMYTTAIYNTLKQYLPKSMEFFEAYRSLPSTEERTVVAGILQSVLDDIPEGALPDKVKLIKKALRRVKI